MAGARQVIGAQLVAHDEQNIFDLAHEVPRSTAAAAPAYLKRMTESPSIREVLDFWFLPLDHPEHGKPRDIWWSGPPEFDAEIRERFSRCRSSGRSQAAWITGGNRPTGRWR